MELNWIPKVGDIVFVAERSGPRNKRVIVIEVLSTTVFKWAKGGKGDALVDSKDGVFWASDCVPIPKEVVSLGEKATHLWIALQYGEVDVR